MRAILMATKSLPIRSVPSDSGDRGGVIGRSTAPAEDELDWRSMDDLPDIPPEHRFWFSVLLAEILCPPELSAEVPRKAEG